MVILYTQKNLVMLNKLITYDYDMLERLSNIVCSITSLNPISANHVYNPNGKLSGLTQRRNGAKVAETGYGYDTEQRFASLTTTKSDSTTILGLNYTYNDAQQITQIAKYAYAEYQHRYATNRFMYDARDQLSKEAHYSNTPALQYSNIFFYDQAQNRVMSVAGLGEAGSLSTDTYFYALANKLIARDATIQFETG